MASSYALDLICLTPNIKPGDPIEIEIFIVGKGSLTHNKMIILYPESLIDENNPGFIESCIGVDKDPSGNIVGPITGKPFLEKMEKKGKETKHELDASGAYYLMNEGNFLENIERPSDPSNAIPRLIAETRHDGLPPIFMKLNSSKKTQSGDYEINFNFTYIDDNNVYLNKKTVKIHVKNWIEIHQKRLQWVACIVGFTALISGIIQTIFTVLQYYKPI